MACSLRKISIGFVVFFFIYLIINFINIINIINKAGIIFNL